VVSPDGEESAIARIVSNPMLVGGVVLAGTCASLVSARLTPFALFAAIAAICAQAHLSGGAIQSVFRKERLEGTLAALLVFALASMLWSEVFGAAFQKIVLAAAVAFGSLAAIRCLESTGSATHTEAAKGLVFGLIAGVGFLAIEVLSEQAIQRAVYNLLPLPRELLQPERHFKWAGDHLESISPSHINRNFAVASLLFFPAITAALGLYGRVRGVWIAGLGSVLALIAIFGSRHESSKVAILAGGLTLALSFVSLTWTRRVLAVGWMLACLAVLPISLLAHRYDLQNASWLQNSMRHRVVIWNYTAEEALKSPIVGIGAYMTYVLGPAYNKDPAREEAGFHVKVSRHAHNVFLQTWFELGAIGALLLTICGLAVISGIGKQREAAQPFVLATFASAMTMMAASYGIWQAWYLALFGMVALACAIGSSVYLRSREEEAARLLPLRASAS
jgi:hypothetical protein